MALTDPARELAFTLALIASGGPEQLDERICQLTDVQEWSADFFKVTFYLIDRFDLLLRETAMLTLDDDIKNDALDSIHSMRSVFASKEMFKQKTMQIESRITGSNATVLKMLSGLIRERFCYHRLETHEQDLIISEVSELTVWLNKIQSEEKDFIRQAIIDGLTEFEFRLKRLHWFGSGYPIESLRDIIHAYLALEGAKGLSENGKELSDAILLKTKLFLKKVLEIVELAKDNTERADWMLRAYGAVSALNDGAVTISGLLGSTSGTS